MIESYITCAIDGRLRIRHPFIMNENLAVAILEFLQSQPLLEKISVNAYTGSVLIEYDPKKIKQDDIVNSLEEYAMSYCVENGHLEELLKFEEKANAERTNSECTNSNNNSKGISCSMLNFNNSECRSIINHSMLVFLASSVGFAFFNKMRGHILTSGIFVVLSMAHLYINRKKM